MTNHETQSSLNIKYKLDIPHRRRHRSIGRPGVGNIKWTRKIV